MALQELRQAMLLSQKRLLTKQANVSRTERWTDMAIFTLQSYSEAVAVTGIPSLFSPKGKYLLINSLPSKRVKLIFVTHLTMVYQEAR